MLQRAWGIAMGGVELAVIYYYYPPSPPQLKEGFSSMVVQMCVPLMSLIHGVLYERFHCISMGLEQVSIIQRVSLINSWCPL